MKFIVIIPARYASTRFPGKPLARLGSYPVIQHVVHRAQQVFNDVAVATDSQLIADAVEGFGGIAVMTSDKHRSGTDRTGEAYRLLGSAADVIINIQGDEPFISRAQLQAIADCFKDDDVDIATLAIPYPKDAPYERLADSNLVKVVVDDNNHAMYFSRSVIPYVRGAEVDRWPAEHQYYTHVGIYAYRAKALERITSLPQSPLEKAESLEQLRWLQAGLTIKVAFTHAHSIGIDTPADLEAAQKALEADPDLRAGSIINVKRRAASL